MIPPSLSQNAKPEGPVKSGPLRGPWAVARHRLARLRLWEWSAPPRPASQRDWLRLGVLWAVEWQQVLSSPWSLPLLALSPSVMGSMASGRGYRAWQHGDFANVPLVRTPAALRQELTLRTLLATEDAGTAIKGAAAAAALTINNGTEDAGTAIKGAATAAAHTLGKGASSASSAVGGLARRAAGGADSVIKRARGVGTSPNGPDPQTAPEGSDFGSVNITPRATLCGKPLRCLTSASSARRER